MTKRACPWCGGSNLTLRNVAGSDPVHNASYLYWDDPDCGYKEKTTSDQYYDYNKRALVSIEMTVVEVHKPKPPLPAHQQPEYLRKGIKTVNVPLGQVTFTE